MPRTPPGAVEGAENLLPPAAAKPTPHTTDTTSSSPGSVLPLCGAAFIIVAIVLLKQDARISGSAPSPRDVELASDVLVAVLGYQAVILLLFGLVGLAAFPMKMLRLTGVHRAEEDLSIGVLKIYRICGLWVASSGAVSAALALGPLGEQEKWWGAVLFATVHTVECLIKWQPEPDVPRQLAALVPNGHLALLLTVAALM